MEESACFHTVSSVRLMLLSPQPFQIWLPFLDSHLGCDPYSRSVNYCTEPALPFTLQCFGPELGTEQIYMPDSTDYTQTCDINSSVVFTVTKKPLLPLKSLSTNESQRVVYKDLIPKNDQGLDFAWLILFAFLKNLLFSSATSKVKWGTV